MSIISRAGLPVISSIAALLLCSVLTVAARNKNMGFDYGPSYSSGDPSYGCTTYNPYFDPTRSLEEGVSIGTTGSPGHSLLSWPYPQPLAGNASIWTGAGSETGVIEGLLHHNY